ncbi:MAG: ABC transporter substrate-binding protein [Chloroflexi bacterium]|nr:ABC transporter substrate-binding protein [Chloroflexota bacterium]
MRLSRFIAVAVVIAAGLALTFASCGETQVVEKEVVKVVTQQVPVEKVVTQIVERAKVVEKEVPVEVQKVVTRVVEKAVIQEKVVTKVVTQVVEVEMEAEAQDPLIVGHLNAFTGSLSYFGPAHRNAAALAADHVNRAGGIDGAAMVIISRDTGVNPVQGVDAARSLVDVDNAVAIVGALASGVTLPVAESVTVPKGVVQISGSSTSPALTVLEDDDYLFRTAASDAAQGVVLARLAVELGFESAGIMYINNAYGEGLADQFEETFTEMGGSVIAKVPHEDAQPTFTSELEKATEGNPDVLVAISYPGQAEIYLRESLEGGYADTFLFVDGTKSPEMVDVVGGDLLEGSHGTAPGSPDSPAVQAFRSAYADAHGGVEPAYPFTSETYDAAVLIALAAAKAGTTTDAEAIRDALREVANPPGEVVGPGVEGITRALQLIAEGKDINYEGAAGPVDFDEHGDVVGPIEIWKIEGGEITSTGRFELP